MPQVTVVIPSYNYAHYLPLTAATVRAQTYSDWEAIIVDDGSTDGTATVATSLADPRFRYIYQPNQGLSAARNTGSRHALGACQVFLDADDQWEPDFLRRCMEMLDSHPEAAGVYTSSYMIDDDGRRLPQAAGKSWSGAAFREHLVEGGFFPVHAATVRSSALAEIGPFDVALSGVADWDLWLRLSARHLVLGISEPLACYRMHLGSMSTDPGYMQADRLAVLKKHFGAPVGEPAGWESDKRRAYACGYRAGAIDYLQHGQPDLAWHLLAQACLIWPPVLGRLDTLYEMACGDQPRGFRGQASLLDLEPREREVMTRLEVLFKEAGPVLAPLRRTALGNAYLALAILSEQAGDWRQARHHMRRAGQANPRIFLRHGTLRRSLKLCAGQRCAAFGRRLLRHTPALSSPRTRQRRPGTL